MPRRHESARLPAIVISLVNNYGHEITVVLDGGASSQIVSERIVRGISGRREAIVEGEMQGTQCSVVWIHINPTRRARWMTLGAGLQPCLVQSIASSIQPLLQCLFQSTVIHIKILE